MSTTVLPAGYIEDILNHVAINLKLTTWSHDVQKFESIGQNYFGVIIPITLTGSEDNQDNNSSGCYQIVLKLAPTDERYRVSGAVTLMFHREIFVYLELLKKYKEIQTKFSTPQYYIPTLYFARDEYCKEVIAMRNMSEAGFRPYVYKAYLDLNHINVALESLGRLHALSFILKEYDGELYEKVSGVCTPLTEASNKRYMDIMTDRLMKALIKFDGTAYQQLLEYLKLNCGKIFEEAVTMVTDTCVCHGDIWKENILFKYEDNQPTQACIIDYQATRISSPAFDTLYLIISSTDTQLRSKSYNSLLDKYYNSFQQILKAFGLRAESVYSRQQLSHDLRIVAPACLITANTALWLSNGLQEEGHVRSRKVFTTPEEKVAAIDEYKTAIKGIIDDFCHYGYLPGDLHFSIL